MKKLRRHNKSAIYLSNVNPARGHNEVRRSTGQILVTTRYSDQERSQSRQNPCQIQPTKNIGNLAGSRQCLWFLLSGVLPGFQNMKYKLQRRLSDVLPIHQSIYVIKSCTKSFLALGGLQTSYATLFTSNDTNQCQNGSSNLPSPCLEQPRSAQIFVAYPRLLIAFSATKRANHAPFSFDQQAQVSRGHTFYRNKEN